MATRITESIAAIAAALAFAGCGKGGDGAQPQLSPEEVAYRKALDSNLEERKRLMTEFAEAQESGDAARIAAAAAALRENRGKSSELVQEHMNLSSSKEQKQ